MNLVLKGTLNTTAVEDGTTVVFESFKKSPAGDWPLTMAFRKEAGYEAVGINDTVYNGTVINALCKHRRLWVRCVESSPLSQLAASTSRCPTTPLAQTSLPTSFLVGL